MAARPGQKSHKKARQTGDKRGPMPYTSAKSRNGRIDGRPRSPLLGAPPMEISMNLIQQLEKEQFEKTVGDQDDPGIRSRPTP